MRALIVLLIALFCAGAVHAGEVYKWVDKTGKVHYGDRPKHDAEALTVQPASGTPDPEDSEAAKTAAAKAAECGRKKSLLEGYRNAASIKETDGLGRSRDYSEEEKQKLIALTEQQVATACAPPAAGG